MKDILDYALTAAAWAHMNEHAVSMEEAKKRVLPEVFLQLVSKLVVEARNAGLEESEACDSLYFQADLMSGNLD